MKRVQKRRLSTKKNRISLISRWKGAMSVFAVFLVSSLALSGSDVAEFGKTQTTSTCSYSAGIAGEWAVPVTQTSAFTVSIFPSGCTTEADTSVSIQFTSGPSSVSTSSSGLPVCVPETPTIHLPVSGVVKTKINCTASANTQNGYYKYTATFSPANNYTIIPTWFGWNATGGRENCTGYNLTTDKSAYTLGDSIKLRYDCNSHYLGVSDTLTVQMIPPGGDTSAAQTFATLQNAASGDYTLSTSSLTNKTSGFWVLRTCINSTTCSSGTNSLTVQVTNPAPTTSTTTTNTSTSTNSSNWVKTTWNFKDGQTSESYILNRTDSEYTTYISQIRSSCMLVNKLNTWRSGAGNDAADNWRNFGIPDCGAGSTTTTNTSCGTNTSNSSCSASSGCYWATKKSGANYCQSTSVVENCTDGVDNDGDEFIDKEDPGCGGTASGTTTTTPGTTTGTASSCASGARCVSGSWCSNGQSFYYPNGDITCVAWSQNGGSVEAPAGTSYCKPTDTSCISPDGYGPSTGWCAQGMKFYQIAKDTNANNDVYCARMPASTGSSTTWSTSDITPPAGYSSCSPTDTNCKQKGDVWTGTNSGFYCMNSQKCSTATGGSCAPMNESCPAGTKYCSSTDMNCIEPGETKTIPATSSSSGNSFWCGGGGMTFYSATQVYCAPKSAGATMMWTSADVKAILAKLGAGWGVCNSRQSYSSGGKCLEPGQTGSSSDWCGWWPPNSSGMVGPVSGATRTCPSFDSVTTVDPKLPPVPEPIKDPIKDPKKDIPRPLPDPFPLPIPMPVPGMDQCRMLRDEVRGHKYELRRIEQNIRYLPKGVETPQAVQDMLRKATVVYDTLEKALAQTTYKSCTTEAYQNFRTQADDLLDRMNSLREAAENIQAYQRIAVLQSDLQKRVTELEQQQKQIGKKGIDLTAEISLLKGLIKKVQTARADMTKIDRFFLEDLEFERMDIEYAIGEKFEKHQEEGRDSYVTEKTQMMRDSIARARADILAKNLSANESCVKVTALFDQFEALLTDAEVAYEKDDRYATTMIFEKMDRYESPVREAAKQCGISFTTSYREPGNPDAMVSRTIALLDEKIQKLTEQIDKLNEASNQLKKRVEESLSALTAIPKEHRAASETAKEAVIDTAKATETAAKNLSASQRARLTAALERAAGKNFCGTIAGDIEKAATSLKTKGENNDLLAEDVDTFEGYVASAEARNGEECYKVGASRFRDTDTAAWYFASFQNQQIFKGGTDAQGRPTGNVDPGREALRAEALIAIERSLGLPGVDGTCTLNANVAGVPAWANCAVNKAAEYRVTFFGPMDQRVTRDEVASWVTALAGDQFPVQGTPAYASGFTDIRSCKTVDAVGTLVANKIMTGFTGERAGAWGCAQPIDRAQLATVLARLNDLLSLTSEIR